MALGPQQMPPQGARALVGALLGGRRRGAEVAATLDESQPGETALVFVNEGRGTAVGLRCLYRSAAGDLSAHSLGNVPPGSTVSCRVDVAPHEPFRCIWACEDEKRAVHLWSYDGRHKRVRRQHDGEDEAFFRATYG